MKNIHTEVYRKTRGKNLIGFIFTARQYYRKYVHARGGVVLVMSGTNPESKNTERCRVRAAIWQITPAARPIQKFRQTKILPDYRCCQVKEYRIKEVQTVFKKAKHELLLKAHFFESFGRWKT